MSLIAIPPTNTSLVIALYLLLQLLVVLDSKPLHIYSSCEKYTVDSNSKYHNNLQTVLNFLSSEAINNDTPGGFYSFSVASNSTDAVYGVILCRGDQDAIGCGSCVIVAAKYDLPNRYCPGSQQAVIWYDECMLRYSNETFLGELTTQPLCYVVGSDSHLGDPTVYTNAMLRTMNDMVDDTAKNKSGKMYTTKMVEVTSSIPLYALQQCTPDLTPDDCKRCLKYAIDQLALFASSRSLTPSCNVRFESFPFYIGAVNFPTLSPRYLNSICENYVIDDNRNYSKNLNTLFNSLSPKAYNSYPPGGFYSTSIANTTANAVYGLFLCRGDQNATICANCVTTATKNDLPYKYCPGAVQAVIWYDECMVRYSNETLLGELTIHPLGYTAGSDSHLGDPRVYANAMYRTMNDMVADTANIKSGKKFTTKMVNVTSSIPLYALQQCTPDLTPDDCKICLKYAIDQLTQVDSSRCYTPSCYVQYESFPFYIIDAVKLSSTPASDITIKHKYDVLAVKRSYYSQWSVVLVLAHR